jgi:mRNA-degrading endonuclease toxin of MazEF toxin-antitoxin module
MMHSVRNEASCDRRSDRPAPPRAHHGAYQIGLINPTRWVIVLMPTIVRADGFRIVIHTNDHRPANVHVFKGGASVKLELDAEGIVAVKKIYRMPRRDLQKAIRLAEANIERLLDAWSEIHGEA